VSALLWRRLHPAGRFALGGKLAAALPQWRFTWRGVSALLWRRLHPAAPTSKARPACPARAAQEADCGRGWPLRGAAWGL